MAATNSTTNLGLPQWVATDKPEMTDFNTAMSDIDSTVTSHLAESVTEDAHGWLSSARFKIGNFTRSTTTPSGTQQVTGLGFKPKALIFYATVPSSSDGRFSQGFDNVSSRNCYWKLIDNSQSITPSYSILIRQGSGSAAQYGASLYTLDDDGFTVEWSKNTSTVENETVSVNYIAFR